MHYRIEGLNPAPFRALFEETDDRLAERRAVRLVATGPGAPCRVSLEEAAAGERLLLVNHVSHDAETPFRATHAIFVREAAQTAASFHDRTPPILDQRTLSLRAFDAEGMLRTAVIAEPGTADGAIRDLLQQPGTAVIHAHNAAYGCFLARIERG